MSFKHIARNKSYNEILQEELANKIAMGKIENYQLKQNVKQLADEVAKMKIENMVKGAK